MGNSGLVGDSRGGGVLDSSEMRKDSRSLMVMVVVDMVLDGEEGEGRGICTEGRSDVALRNTQDDVEPGEGVEPPVGM